MEGLSFKLFYEEGQHSLLIGLATLSPSSVILAVPLTVIPTSKKGQAPKSDIPPNIAPKVVTPEIYLQVWDSSATLIGQLAIVTLFVQYLKV